MLFLFADQAVILMKCPYLVNEMVNICASLVAMAMSGRGTVVKIIMRVKFFRGNFVAVLLLCTAAHLAGLDFVVIRVFP